MDVGWSSEGNQLIFGMPSAALNPAISLLNLNTHERLTLPGSKGLFSPRWSPDGQYIAALTADGGTLRLFEVATQKWVELARLPIGYPNWSRDSKFIFFDTNGTEPAFYRVRISDHKVDQLVSLTNIRRTGTFVWTGLALDDSLSCCATPGQTKFTPLTGRPHDAFEAVCPPVPTSDLAGMFQKYNAHSGACR